MQLVTIAHVQCSTQRYRSHVCDCGFRYRTAIPLGCEWRLLCHFRAMQIMSAIGDMAIQYQCQLYAIRPTIAYLCAVLNQPTETAAVESAPLYVA